jgi:hypothetical protein
LLVIKLRRSEVRITECGKAHFGNYFPAPKLGNAGIAALRRTAETGYRAGIITSTTKVRGAFDSLHPAALFPLPIQDPLLLTLFQLFTHRR